MGHGCQARLRIPDLVNPSLLSEAPYGFDNSVVGQQLDGAPQLGLLLTDDFLEASRPHPGRLHLLEGLAGLDGLVLANVSHKQNAVRWAKTIEEFVNLLRAGEA